MTTAKMKIRPFTITEGGHRVLGVLRDAKERDLDARYLPTKSGGRIRIDDLESKEMPGGEQIWLMNFVRSREGHGPVKVSEEQDQVTPINYQEDERPGEEVAALFAPATNYMLVHITTHFRVAVIARYCQVK